MLFLSRQNEFVVARKQSDFSLRASERTFMGASHNIICPILNNTIIHCSAIVMCSRVSCTTGLFIAIHFPLVLKVFSVYSREMWLLVGRGCHVLDASLPERGARRGAWLIPQVDTWSRSGMMLAMDVLILLWVDLYGQHQYYLQMINTVAVEKWQHLCFAALDYERSAFYR